MYDEEFRKEVVCKARVSGQGVIDFEYFWRGNSIYKTQVTAQETNIKKSKSIVQGISIRDMDDGMTSFESEFEAAADAIPVGLKPKLPTPTPKASPSTKLQKIDNKKPAAKKKISQGDAIKMWSSAAIKMAKDAGGDPNLKKRIVDVKTKSVQYIMAGLTGKEAIEHALDK